jgi:hypothetical protein
LVPVGQVVQVGLGRMETAAVVEPVALVLSGIFSERRAEVEELAAPVFIQRAQILYPPIFLADTVAETR